MKALQIFQQPDARDAVNGGHKKLNPCELIGLEGYKPLLNGGFIEVGVRLAVDLLPVNAGAIAERGVFAQIIIVEDFKHRDAAPATKCMAFTLNRRCLARLAAMKAGDLYVCWGVLTHTGVG